MANWLISAKPPITKGNLNENHVFILDILNDYRSLSLQVLNEWLGENQSFGAGSAESPSLKFTSGGGLFAPDTHSIAIASSGLTRLRIASTGSAVVGATAPTAGVGLDVSLAPTGAVNTVGVKVTGEVQPDVSTEHQAFSSYPKVKTGTTLAALTHYCASQPTLGGDVTTQAGFKVSDSLTGAENNYGFYGLLSAAAGRYNLYMSGTAKNFLQGNTGIGVLPDDTYTLKVYGQSYLPWVQSGADGVARDVATRLRDRCCVEDFGATGVDDDTDAFQSAIDWLPASGGTIWLTKEDYRINGTLNAGTKLIKWANVRKINSLVHHGKLPGVTETFCSGAAGYYEIQRAVAKETDGYTLSVYRDANYTGTSATDTASVKSRLYLRSTIGTSGQTKVESGVSTDVVNESLYAAGYALAAYAKRTVDGRTVGIYCVADDYAAGAGLTKTTLSGDFELRCADTDANSMRTIMRLTAHSQNAVDYDEDAKISTGLRVRASTANLGAAIGVDQIGNAEIDTGLDLSDVEFESDAIAIRTDNWINLAGDEETRKGLRYNSSTQLIEVSKPFAVGTTSLCTNLNADLLDGQEGSYYRNADNLNAGTLPAARFNDTAHGSRSGGALHSGATAETAGFMTPAQVIKLDGIETGATADQTGQEILAALLPYDGSGSELDSDKLDGQQGSYYTDIPSRLGYTPVNKAGDTMTGLLYFSSITPGWRVSETDQGTDLKNWQFSAYNQKLYFQSLNDDWTSPAILATLDRSGNWDVSGYLLSNTGIRSKIPSSPWETSGTWIGVSGYGQLYSPGSFRVGVYSNGYRNSSGQWTSFSVNGNTGASGIDLDPAGYIYVRCEVNKPTGDTMDVDRVAFFSPTTGLNIDLGLKVTGTVAAKDRVAVGGESFWTGRGVVVQGSTVCTGNTSTMGYYSNVAIGNDVTTSHYQYYSYPSVASGTNTLGSLLHFAAAANTFGQTVTNQYGFYAGSTLTGAVNNYGFFGQIASGTNRYNLYMAGTAYNYLAGCTGIGVLPSGSYALKVSGDLYVDGDFTVIGSSESVARAYELADGSVSEPSLTNTGDTNTGAYFPDADQFAITCGGTQRGLFSSSGLTVTGVCAATSFSGSGASLTGVDAATLDTIDSSSFLRSDQADSTSASLQVIPPANLWSANSNYNIGGSSTPLGILYSHGNYRVSLISNGYRNSDTQWTSFEANSKTGAAGIELDPNGYIYLQCDAAKANGDAFAIDTIATVSATGVEITGSCIATTFSGGGASLTSLDSGNVVWANSGTGAQTTDVETRLRESFDSTDYDTLAHMITAYNATGATDPDTGNNGEVFALNKNLYINNGYSGSINNTAAEHKEKCIWVLTESPAEVSAVSRHCIGLNAAIKGADHGNCIRATLNNYSTFVGANTAVYGSAASDSTGYKTVVLHGEYRHGCGNANYYGIGLNSEVSAFSTLGSLYGLVINQATYSRDDAGQTHPLTGAKPQDNSKFYGIYITGNVGNAIPTDSDITDTDSYGWAKGIWITQKAIRSDGEAFRNASPAAYGILFTNTAVNSTADISLEANSAFGLRCIGTYTTAAITVKSGQRISLATDGSVYMVYNSGTSRLNFYAGGTCRGHIDLSGSDHEL
jgi:hypothetical protein